MSLHTLLPWERHAKTQIVDVDLENEFFEKPFFMILRECSTAYISMASFPLTAQSI
jgi:hypothetical protein